MNTTTKTREPDNKSRLTALLRERSLIQGDFVLASGHKSKYYIDARRTTMAGEGLVLIGELGLSTLRTRGWAPRAVGGLTLGADPIAYAMAHAARLAGQRLDAFTVRKEPKAHGAGKRIEGCLEAGDPVVIIEDVITTGRSAREAIDAVREAGAKVLGVLAVVDREEGGRAQIEAAGVAVVALVAVSELGG